MISEKGQEWRGAESSVVVHRPAPGVFVFVFSGRPEAELVPHIKSAVQPTVDAGDKVDLFFDTKDMKGYHPQFREDMTRWHEEMKPHTRSAGVLVESKVVAMAIAVANLAAGGLLKAHTNRRSFETALEQACRANR